MKKLAVLLALLPLVLYPTGFWICEIFFEDDINKWRLLRDTLKGVEILCLCSIYLLPKNKIASAAMSGLLIYCLGNMVDRLFFGIHEFMWTDCVLIIGSTMVFILKLKGREIIFRRNSKSNN